MKNSKTVITCAVTGGGNTVQKSDKVPVTPKQIAAACLEANKAGAAVVHVHVRDPKTGLASRDPQLYREVVERVRDSGTNVILNLTFSRLRHKRHFESDDGNGRRLGTQRGKSNCGYRGIGHRRSNGTHGARRGVAAGNL